MMQVEEMWCCNVGQLLCDTSTAATTHVTNDNVSPSDPNTLVPSQWVRTLSFLEHL